MDTNDFTASEPNITSSSAAGNVRRNPHHVQDRVSPIVTGGFVVLFLVTAKRASSQFLSVDGQINGTMSECVWVCVCMCMCVCVCVCARATARA